MLPRWESVHIDGVVLLYVAGLIVLTTLASGLVPAIAGRRDLVAGLKAAGRSGDLSGAKRLRAGLVVAEIALAIAVVICAGLIVRSFITLTHVSLGFDSKNVYVVQAPDMPKARYPKFMDNLAAGRRLAGEIEKIPGVREVALATVVPFEGGFTVTTIVPGYKPAEDVDTNAVSPGYFHALGIPLLRGRDFDSGDRFDSQQVAIVSAAFAKRYFHTLNVVGRAIHPQMDSGEKKQIRTVVGVVGDMRES